MKHIADAARDAYESGVKAGLSSEEIWREVVNVILSKKKRVTLTKDILLEKLSNGMTVSQIAHEVDRSYSYIRTVLKIYDIALPSELKNKRWRPNKRIYVYKHLDTLIQCRDQGMLMNQAAEKIGVSRQRVHQISQKHGIVWMKNTKVTNPKILELHSDGLTTAEISKATDTDLSTVRLALKNHGLRPNKRKSLADRIVSHLKDGKTLTEVARLENTNPQYCWNVAKSRGITEYNRWKGTSNETL